MQGEFAGIGISVAPKFDDKGALVFGADKSKGPLMDHDDDGNVKISSYPRWSGCKGWRQIR